MAFKMKYQVKADYISKGTERRSGLLMPKVSFVVAHDTGNEGSTAQNNVTYFKNSAETMSASAHIFVDDHDIIECIPLLTGTPEKAWHVLYNITLDNQLYGDDANDIAAGVEYCFGSNINANEAYKRYVWTIAYICYKFKLSPSKVVGHMILDPNRKTDPKSGLARSGRSYSQLLQDIVKEYQDCTAVTPPPKPVYPTIVGTWSRGESGAEVAKIQRYLTILGYKVTATGYFGTLTESMVKKLQADHHMTVDGVVGPITINEIMYLLKIK